MEPMQITTAIARFENATAFSALPHAPVVAEVEHRHLARSRLRLARTLHRLADAVAPAAQARQAPRRAYAGGR